jgi:hypothetical protein
MPFDVELWKQQAGQNLQHLSRRLDQFKQRQAPTPASPFTNPNAA